MIKELASLEEYLAFLESEQKLLTGLREALAAYKAASIPQNMEKVDIATARLGVFQRKAKLEKENFNETPLAWVRAAIAACDAYLEDSTIENLSVVNFLWKRANSSSVKSPSQNLLIGQTILETYSELPVELFNQLAKQATEQVTILHTWISYEYLEKKGIAKALIQAAKNGADVDVYLLNALDKGSPGYKVAKQRNADLGFKDQDPSKIVRYNRDHLVELSEDNGVADRLKVHFYTKLPPLEIFRCDNTALIGFFLPNIRATKGIHYKIELDRSDSSDLFNGAELERLFEDLRGEADIKTALLLFPA